MNFNRFDLIKYLGESKTNAFFVKLRKESLGTFKMSTVKRVAKNSTKLVDALCLIVIFNPDDVIKHYQEKKERYINDTYLTVRPQYIQAWDRAIEIAKHFKELK